jgi:DNA-binding transcriptional ArsR family regulator
METALAIDTQLLKGGAGVLRALNNRARQSIVKFIHKEKKVNVSTIYKKLRMEQSVASQHLRILRDGEFVITERQGKEIYYTLNYERFANVDRVAKELLK